MSTLESAPSPAAVAAATEVLGGSVVPLNRALRALGWPFLSRSAVHSRRLAGTLPVTPRQLGCRWVVFACDAARLFEGSAGAAGEPVALTPQRRGPGRPRKQVQAREETADD